MSQISAVGREAGGGKNDLQNSDDSTLLKNDLVPHIKAKSG